MKNLTLLLVAVGLSLCMATPSFSQGPASQSPAPVSAADLPAPAPIKVCQVDVKTNQPVADACFTVPAGVVAALNQKIASETIMKSVPDPDHYVIGPDGKTAVPGQKMVGTPAYQNLFDLFMKHVLNTLVLPTLDRYPTPEMQKLRKNAEDAQKALDSAKAALAQGQIPQ